MDPSVLALTLICAFFAVCFGQSGIDKVVDWKGNLGWLNGHFAQSPLRGTVAPLLGFITLLELAAAVLCTVAARLLLFGKAGDIPHWALGLSGATLLMLFTGQRLAKDYPGAATLATYFLLAIFGLTLAG